MSGRRANGEGSWRKRKNGSWEYRVVVGIGDNGKPLRKSFYGETKQLCRDKHEDFKNTGVILDKVLTVAQWAPQWLAVYKADISVAGQRTNRGYINNHIIPALGSFKLEQVRPIHLEKFIQSKRELSWSTRHGFVLLLKGMFRDAVENRLCITSPAEKLSAGPYERTEAAVFNYDEISRILDFAPAHKHGYIVELLLYTGMRQGELLALKWADVGQELVTIRATVATGEGHAIEKGTKTNTVRHVGISEELRNVFSRVPRRGLYVLTNNAGGRLDKTSFGDAYRAFFGDLNASLEPDEQVQYLSPHKCRHTYATHALSEYKDLRLVQTLLGHKRVTTTQIYTHKNLDDVRTHTISFAGNRGKTGVGKSDETEGMA